MWPSPELVLLGRIGGGIKKEQISWVDELVDIALLVNPKVCEPYFLWFCIPFPQGTMDVASVIFDDYLNHWISQSIKNYSWDQMEFSDHFNLFHPINYINKYQQKKLSLSPRTFNYSYQEVSFELFTIFNKWELNVKYPILFTLATAQLILFNPLTAFVDWTKLHFYTWFPLKVYVLY